MKQTMFKAMLLALPLTLAVPAIASPPEDTGDAAGEEPTEAEALEDDILLVIDLPIATDEARTAGIEEAEISVVLDAAVIAGLPASEVTEVIDEETEVVKAKGKRKAFGQWVKQQIAEGKRGKELAAAIKDRKEELAEMSDEEKAELDNKLKEMGEKNREKRKKLHDLRKQLRDEGKAIALAGKERHDKVMAEAGKRHAEAKAEWKKHHGGKHHGKPGDKIDDKQEAIDEKQEAIDEKQDAVGNDPTEAEKLEKKEDNLEKKEDKLEKLEDKKEAKDAKHEGHDKGGKGDKKGPG
jgi:DNA repair exonuclease SbcCD ATPase subunit